MRSRRAGRRRPRHQRWRRQAQPTARAAPSRRCKVSSLRDGEDAHVVGHAGGENGDADLILEQAELSQDAGEDGEGCLRA